MVREPLKRLLVGQHLAQWAIQVPGEQRGALVEGRVEGRFGRIQLQAHARVLAAVAREEEGYLRRGLLRGHAPPPDIRIGLARRDFAQAHAQFRHRTRDHAEALGEGIASHLCGIAQVAQIHLRVRVQVADVCLDIGIQRRRVPRRDGQQVQRARICACLQRRLWGSLQNHVGIAAADSKGTHARHPWFSGLRPRRHSGGYRHPKPLPGDARVELGDVQRRRHSGVLDRHHHLAQPGHPSGSIQVADVALDRADQQGGYPRRRTPHPKHLVQRPNLNRVALPRPCAVSLHILDRVRIHPRLPQCLSQQRPLRLPIGRRHRPAVPTVVERRTPDHRQNRIARRLGRRQALQNHHSSAFTHPKAIRPLVEGFAAPIG